MPVILNPRNAALVRVDEAKVKRLMGQPKVLASPLLGVVENGKIWLINGYHRLAAMGRGRIARRDLGRPQRHQMTALESVAPYFITSIMCTKRR